MTCQRYCCAIWYDSAMRNERGFTLPELIVVLIFVLMLLGGAMYILRVHKYEVEGRNAERRMEIAALSRGTGVYIKAKGALPDVPDKATAIGSYKGQYNLCKYTVPKYSYDMPLDPLQGAKVIYDTNNTPTATDEACNADGVEYTTGYTIRKNKDGHLVFGIEKPERERITFTMP